MDARATQYFLNIVGDSRAMLPDRLQALNHMVTAGGPAVAPDLKNLLDRSRPALPSAKNWDPQAGDRVVDLHLVAALYKLGDHSELGRIVQLVRQAGNVLVGSDDELHNAALVLRAIGRKEPLGDLIALTADSNTQAVRNAVRVLEELKLPEQPAGTGAQSMPGASRKLAFTAATLREELQTVASVAHDSVILSPGVEESLWKNNYGRGPVRRDGETLADFLDKDLPFLEFDYFLDGGRAVICTYSEAAVRWQAWWRKHSADLVYRPESLSFALRTGE